MVNGIQAPVLLAGASPATSDLGCSWSRRDVWIATALCLATFISRALFVYSGGTPDPDPLVMAAGMAMGTAGDMPLGDTMLYGRQVNPGMYAIVHVVYPLFFKDPSQMLPFLNWLSVGCFSLMMWPLYVLLRSQFCAHVSLAIITLAISAAVVWDTSTYFHPIVPASLLLFTALTCLRRWRSGPGGWVYLAVGVSLAAVAFVIRVEVAFVSLAFLARAMAARSRLRNLLVLLVAGALIAASYLVVLRSLSQETTVSYRGLGGYLELIRSSYFHTGSYRALPRSVTWLVLSVGWATVVMSLLGIGAWIRGAGMRGDRRNSMLLFGLAWALPSILFWVPQPIPIVRHYFLATFGVAFLSGVLVLSRLPVRRMWILTLTVVVLNLSVPDIAYRVYNASPARRPKVPNGSFFYFHEAAAERIERFQSMATAVVDAARRERQGPARKGAVVMVTWEGYAYMMYRMASDGQPLRKTFGETIGWNSHHHRHQLGDVEIVMIDYTYFVDAELRSRATGIIRESVDLGYAFYAPREIKQQVEDGSGLAGSVTYY